MTVCIKVCQKFQAQNQGCRFITKWMKSITLCGNRAVTFCAVIQVSELNPWSEWRKRKRRIVEKLVEKGLQVKTGCCQEDTVLQKTQQSEMRNTCKWTPAYCPWLFQGLAVKDRHSEKIKKKTPEQVKSTLEDSPNRPEEAAPNWDFSVFWIKA